MTSMPKILRIKEVVNCVGISKSSIERGVLNKTFPQPIKLGVRSKGWHLAHIVQWIEDRSNNTNKTY